MLVKKLPCPGQVLRALKESLARVDRDEVLRSSTSGPLALACMCLCLSRLGFGGLNLVCFTHQAVAPPKSEAQDIRQVDSYRWHLPDLVSPQYRQRDPTQLSGA
jgi:hypothetical protein